MVIAGEDGNDRKSLRILLEAGCPELRGRLVEIKDNVRLRSALGEALRRRVSVLHRKALARAEREGAQLACMFVHEDWDDVDGVRSDEAHARVHVQGALDVHAGPSHYVLTVWEMEAWLLLFPAALKAVCSAWSVPATYQGRDTGRLSDPKRVLRTDCGDGSRRYQEADAPAVLQEAVNGKHLDAPTGSNRSWTRFRQDAQRCCVAHLAVRRP